MRTRALLQDFLRRHTGLELFPVGEGFCALHREDSDRRPVVLRADYDALATPDGTPCHLCGHDGHAAALCGAALLLEGRRVGRTVALLFQPAEETGAGAAPCCEIFDRLPDALVFGCHNLPGFPFGQVLTRPGTFACASRGVTLFLTGKPTHAAYPENGVSPASAVGKLLCLLPELAAPEKYTGMALCTVIGVRMGEKAFGAAAEKAEVWLTLRGEHNTDLELLRARVLEGAGQLAKESGLGFRFEEQDVFPATENTPEQAEAVLATLRGSELAEPMRWSEDFGHYLLHRPGAFFGIGCGEAWPALHTRGYEFPDALLPLMAKNWITLAEMLP